jgi:outer membrane lipoprotein SlyB
VIALEENPEMKSKTAVLFACIASFAMAGEAIAAGCLKGAAAGGVAGHFVGNGHAVLGAAGGCVVGRHMANKKAKEDATTAQSQQMEGQSQHVQAEGAPQGQQTR